MSETVKNQILVNDVRLARVSLTQPFRGRNQQPDPKTGKVKEKYHVDAIFAQAHPQFGAVQEVIRGVATAKWKENTPQILEMIRGNNQRFCLQRGDLYRPGKPEYAGLLYISAGNEEQPTLVASINGVNVANRLMPGQPPSTRVLTPADPQWPYAGCYANVHLQFYTYDYNGSPGLGCGVLGVQFLRHGERLKSAAVSSGSEFGVVPSDADGAPPAAPQSGGAGLI